MSTSKFSLSGLSFLKYFFLSMILFLTLSACSEDKAKQDSVAKKSGGALAESEKLYTANCKVCHAQGINGAPIVGNKKMWSERVPKGKATLTEHAINGFGLMPAKGGRTELSDEDVGKIVDYMLSQVK